MSLRLGLSKARFKFSCAHFTIFPDGHIERLHGHNYQVRFEIGTRTLRSQSGMIIDFAEMKQWLGELCDDLDERVLLPSDHPELLMKELDDNIEIEIRNKRYSFPRDDVCVLPLRNITVEELAFHLGTTILEKVRIMPDWSSIKLRITETAGQWAEFSHRLPDPVASPPDG